MDSNKFFELVENNLEWELIRKHPNLRHEEIDNMIKQKMERLTEHFAMIASYLE